MFWGSLSTHINGFLSQVLFLCLRDSDASLGQTRRAGGLIPQKQHLTTEGLNGWINSPGSSPLPWKNKSEIICCQSLRGSSAELHPRCPTSDPLSNVPFAFLLCSLTALLPHCAFWDYLPNKIFAPNSLFQDFSFWGNRTKTMLYKKRVLQEDQ